MWRLHPLLLFLSCFPLLQLADSSNIRIPLVRRGGRLARHENANLDLLQDNLKEAEDRYSFTRRDVENNRLARRWLPKDDVLDEDALLTNTEMRGPWYAKGSNSERRLTSFQVRIYSSWKPSTDTAV